MATYSLSARRSPFRIFDALLVFCLLLLAWSATAQQTSPTQSNATSPTQAALSGPKLNLDSLLADPIASQPIYQLLVDRRNELARGDRSPESFIKTADELEKLGAWYSAMELLWWADKITDAPAQRKDLAKRMQDLQEKSRKSTAEVDAALQVWASGGPAKAVQKLSEVALAQPYNEKAHYELGYRTFLSYSAHDYETKGGIPLESRARHFRLCYEEFLITIAIDPLFNDAYYQLNQARGMLGDQPEFVQRTEKLTQRALDFRTEVLTGVEKIDSGDRTPENFVETGDGLAQVEQFAYAVYAYQAALAHAKDKPELAKAIQAKIDAIRKDKIPASAAR